MELTYKFNNDEKKIALSKVEYLDPEYTEVYAREGDNVYVNDGDYVYINQLLKESAAGIKTYATISGDIDYKDDVIRIVNDHTNSAFVSEEALDSIENVKKEELIKACENLGIDYDNKLIVNKLKDPCKLLVVNALDVEPYQFNSNYLVQDNVTNLLDIMNLISRRFNINAHLLLSKYDDNNVDAVNKVIKDYPDINFKVIPDVFPNNTNQVLARKYFDDYKFEDILFLDAFALYKIFVAVKDGLPVGERYITVCYEGASRVFVVNTKYGSNVGEMIRKGVNDDLNDVDIYLNNFMRKVKCPNIDNLIVTDNIRSIFIFPHKDVIPSKCIKCGKCIDICPIGINPMAKKLDPNCIRCGLCNFVCPANINLINREKDIKE
ncbi:MAG: 4Fe-4S binding protein [Bacilli bacterium]|nr:4Fe-4S binding protein [Bacilli bacterium]